MPPVVPLIHAKANRLLKRWAFGRARIGGRETEHERRRQNRCHPPGREAGDACGHLCMKALAKPRYGAVITAIQEISRHG